MRKAYIGICPIGVFAFNEKKELIDKKLFSRDPKKVAGKLLNLERKKGIKQEKELKEQLEKEYDVQTDSIFAEKTLNKNIRSLSRDFGFKEPNVFLSEVGVEITKEKIKKAFKKEDLVIQAINFLDELDKINNLFSERVREWYSLYFPELNHLIKDHQKFTQIISIICRKKEFKKEKLNKYVKNSIAKEIEKKSKESIGSKMNEEDLHIIKDLAEVSKNSYKLREETNNYIKRIIKEIAPNLNELAGPMLTARLIDLTGSLEKLSKLPSSTIQVIGAEKSLFKHLKGHAPSPKHGVIYMHSAIHSVPPSERGKIARKLANKICVAAKADYFTGNFLADELKEDLEKEIKELRK